MIEEKRHMDCAWRLATAMFVLVLLSGTVPAGAAPDCRGRLQFDEPYECLFRGDQSAALVGGSILFEEFDGNAFQATLDFLGEASVAHCTCKTSPPNRFDQAKGFECVTGFAASVAETFEANVSGNGGKLSKGQLWSSDPLGQGFARFIFDCRATSANDETGGDDGDSDGDRDGDSDGDSDSAGDPDGDSDDRSGDKVLLCHKGKKTMEVPSSSVQKHLDHGDTLGACD